MTLQLISCMNSLSCLYGRQKKHLDLSKAADKLPRLCLQSALASILFLNSSGKIRTPQPPHQKAKTNLIRICQFYKATFSTENTISFSRWPCRSSESPSPPPLAPEKLKHLVRLLRYLKLTFLTFSSA